MADHDLISRRPGRVDQLGLFAAMWAMAAAWHVLGNTTQGSWWTQAAVAVGVTLVLLNPGAPVPLAVLAASSVALVWDEAPTLGNHWLLAGFVNLAILMSVGTAVLRRRPHDRLDLANRLLPVARLCVLGFYGFAAFAKLNTAFFDRSVSCAVHYFRESTDSVGLSGLQLGGAAWLDHLVIVGTALVELSIPVLLVVPRSRRVGVVVALGFHTLVAIDHSHQFFDFSSLLFALFVLFLPEGAGPWTAERVGSVRARLALRHGALPRRVHLGLAAIPAIAVLLVALDVLDASSALDVGWWPWQVFAVGTTVTVLRYLRQERRAPLPRALVPHHALFALVPVLVLLNGLTPYLELKTGYGWNMYANLRTVDGDTNHYLVPRTLPLTDEQEDPVVILSSDDPVLERYETTGYALTWRQLRWYLSDHPEVRITYRRGSSIVALAHASDAPELVDADPSWREKLQLFRAIDLEEPERCVPTFGPAR